MRSKGDENPATDTHIDSHPATSSKHDSTGVTAVPMAREEAPQMREKVEV